MSTDDNISDSATYNETTNNSITFNYFPLQVVTLDDCYTAEMFLKQLNSLAIPPNSFWILHFLLQPRFVFLICLF